MPLHTDLRIKDFDDFLGNDGIIDSIIAKIEQKNRPQVYLFSGAPGTGKTTLARLFAQELGLNVDERNAANDNGVDFARSFIRDINHPGFKGPTMYILDEAQRLTNQAQNILLTTLEEPPEHAYVAFCTTEPEKIIDAVLRRCTKYSLGKPPRKILTAYLTKINEEYSIGATPESIKAIVSVSKSSTGDALMYMEQIKGVDPYDQVSAIKSYMSDSSEVVELCRTLLNGSWNQVSDIYAKGIDADPERIRKAVMGYMSKVLLGGRTEAFPILKAFENVRVENGMYGIIRASYEGVALRIKGGY